MQKKSDGAYWELNPGPPANLPVNRTQSENHTTRPHAQLIMIMESVKSLTLIMRNISFKLTCIRPKYLVMYNTSNNSYKTSQISI